MGGWTYIMAAKPSGMLYVGVTANLVARVDQHRRDVGAAFWRFGIKTLVYALLIALAVRTVAFEPFPSHPAA